MSIHPEKQAFLNEIAADRYDWKARKIYADWCEDHGDDDEAAKQRAWTPEFQKAEDFLREFAEEKCLRYGKTAPEFGLSPITYEELIAFMHEYLDTGETMYINVDTPDYDAKEVWGHFQTVTGRDPEGGPINEWTEEPSLRFISCGC